MDTAIILGFLSEIAYLLVVFGIMFTIAVFMGRQAIINLIIGLYLALLISLEFPYYEQLLGHLNSGESVAAAKLALFGLFTLITTWLSFRIMPDEFREKKIETLGKKFLLAGAATVLVMIFSFHVLPVTEFLTPGTPIQSLFAPEQSFFWWLLLPLAILFVF
ncbi:MAG: hypothetical protein AAB388_01735 [Patescibacteria group bacterium]